ncbi:acyltransferase [Paraflavitalea sp. CAU 1676]|uniref:acyltransferase family protein n=1 Tax=Paraflavitalea sp. CAU 1676 TaxID=3032598 RepID=UPI0023DA51DB|nr:acyltransferase [Paraflavitalea sp. CAU 1676]MDF2193466.1 acyltransferase [Paraflavitalea sp. CAU 1676]
MTHIKQLDAIRAIAVLLVLVWHGFPVTHLINHIPNGPIGVNMFFVLSGYLITRILMEDRLKAERTNLPRLMVFKNFFFRRALRIFPIYYLTVFALWLANGFANSNIEPNIGYFLTYTSNFYFFRIQGWDGLLSHTWSLSIEEQFYLVWPWIMLFLNRKLLLPLIIGSIVIGIVSQYAVTPPYGELLPHTCLHAFGTGALLSWIMVFRPAALPGAYKVLGIFGAAAVVILVLEIMIGNWQFAPVRLLTAAITGWLIACVLLKRDQLAWPLSWVLNNKPLIFLGKISYGIYLYHPIIPHYTLPTLNAINQHIPIIGNHLLFIEQNCLVILTAWLSWMLIERPILGLKKYFVLPGKKAPVPVDVAGQVAV